MKTIDWNRLSTIKQLGNIGAEIGRTISWKRNPAYGNYVDAFYRGLEYLDLSINDSKNSGPKRKELCRLREVLADWFLGSHLYHTTDEQWNKYFMSYAIAANRHK